ncbi:hypothetical protein B4U80_03302 [Leptotrombidium deliense]|uniref:Dynamin-like GTPase OPA1, mitochondrial n=1 Tax=Leptotrombidium deliense TaxID=299467 RepID=A0A443SG65_9ACAR|nr:hypothetical protein B4U80_03302 [Leptotrombidium deliense]
MEETVNFHYTKARHSCLIRTFKLTVATATQRKLHSIANGNAIKRKRLLTQTNLKHVQQIRNIGLVYQIVRNVLKIRYIVLGSLVGGGYTASKKYEEWKNGLPDLSWIKDIVPEQHKFDEWSNNLAELRDKYGEDTKSWISRFSNELSDKYELFNQWVEEAKLARQLEQQGDLAAQEEIKKESGLKKPLNTALSLFQTTADERAHQQQERLEKLQDELMNVQLKYQREIERLEKENKTIKKQLLIKSQKDVPQRKVKKSLIDMYSEVLDELSDYDTTYNTQDHLPRVIVVGDQSAGKTSVLEMIAGARIFPRGSGEMMTRAPVKVTLSEGPYHIAKFKDSAREFDLTKESELADLRREVEIRMKNSIRGGKSVSNEVISMSVQGPGLQRVVLVDLPGIISTVTSEMAQDTRDAIRDITKTYMSNPNAIILCIQDGSVDAERSIVTDLVSQMDPTGKRTIFVLTKVDIAEQNMANPTRIKKILDGKLFPMKALGYFAVVTGGGKDDSINSIKKLEEQFFRNSKLCKEGILNTTQCTTPNLSLAVSDCFWKMVKASVAQQADAFKATRFNLETEWKNSYPRLRELDRDELFERARGEMLDEIINLSQLSPKHWEEVISKRLWDKVSIFVFEQIYLPSAHNLDAGTFKTQVDIRLRQWAELTLPEKAVDVGWETLREEFDKLVEKTRSSKTHDDVFDNLKTAVSGEAMHRHKWEPKAADVLRVIQLNALEDYSIPDKQQWDSALEFLEKSVRERLSLAESQLNEMVGPGFTERWTHWKSKTKDQHVKSAIKYELDKIAQTTRCKLHKPVIDEDELTAIKKNLQTQNIEVDSEMIKQVWYPLYRINFLKRSLNRANDCRKCFYMYHQGLESDVNCDDIVLFWRIKRMLAATSNALRQQVVNREARRLEKEIKDVLDDFSQDQEKKVNLLTGRRVQLAEELKRVRQIQEKLEEFIAAGEHSQNEHNGNQ